MMTTRSNIWERPKSVSQQTSANLQHTPFFQVGERLGEGSARHRGFGEVFEVTGRA